MDYLSYLTLKATHPGNGQPKGNGPDYIVLNSVSNVGKAIPVLKAYWITIPPEGRLFSRWRKPDARSGTSPTATGSITI